MIVFILLLSQGLLNYNLGISVSPKLAEYLNQIRIEFFPGWKKWQFQLFTQYGSVVRKWVEMAVNSWPKNLSDIHPYIRSCDQRSR